jgi:hypothetical protein
VKAIVEQGPKQADPKVNAKLALLILLVMVISAQKQADLMLADPKVNAKQALLILLVMVIVEQGPKQADPKANAKQAPLILPVKGISAPKQASPKVIAKLILLVKGIAGGLVLALKPESVCLMI